MTSSAQTPSERLSSYLHVVFNLMKIEDEQEFGAQFSLHQDMFVKQGETVGQLMQCVVRRDWIHTAVRLLDWSQKNHTYNDAWALGMKVLNTVDMLNVFLNKPHPYPVHSWMEWRAIRDSPAEVFEHCVQYAMDHQLTFPLNIIVEKACQWGCLHNLNVIEPYMTDDHKYLVLSEACARAHQDIMNDFFTPALGQRVMQGIALAHESRYDPKGIEYLHALIQHDLLSAEVGDTAHRPRKPKM